MLRTLVFFIRPWLSSSRFNFLLGGLLFPAQIVFSSSAPSYNLMRGRGRPRTKTKKIEKYFSGLIYVISWQWITSTASIALFAFSAVTSRKFYVSGFSWLNLRNYQGPLLRYFETSRQYQSIRYTFICVLIWTGFQALERNCSWHTTHSFNAGSG